MLFNIYTRNDYVYYCDGTNDNIKISNLVKSFLQGGSNYDSMRLSIVGNIGIQSPARGSGTVTDYYGWFDIGVASNRKVILDFTNCSQITPPIINGSYNAVFYSTNDVHIIGANVVGNNTTNNTVIRIANTTAGSISFENSRFWITGYKDSIISQRGDYFNCRGSVTNVNSNTYCFLPSSYSIVRIYGGEYSAYTNNSNQSAIIGQSDANAISILYGVNAPTVTRSGYRQTSAIIQYVGGGYVNCTDLITTLPITVVAGISNIRGTIPLNKG